METSILKSIPNWQDSKLIWRDWHVVFSDIFFLYRFHVLVTQSGHVGSLEKRYMGHK